MLPPTVLYCISDGEYIKIGYSYKPLERMALLQMGNARALILAFAFEPSRGVSAQDLERFVHKTLKRFYVRGEWFGVSLKVAKQTIMNADVALKDNDFARFFR